jgi:hypothetical protein
LTVAPTREKNGMNQAGQVIGQWTRKPDHGFTAAIVLTEDIQKTTLLENGVFRPRRWRATLSEDSDTLSFSTKIKKGFHWIF